MKRSLWLLLGLLSGLALWLMAGRRSGLSEEGERRLDQAIQEAIEQKKMPGAVLLVGHRGRVVFRRAYGQRALEPKPEPMTEDTIFDVSSLTKLVATATSVMILVERGRLQLSDPISKYLPEIQDPVAGRVTIERLLTHSSGYPNQLDLRRPWKGKEGALQELARLPVNEGTQAEFRYSDVNYIALGLIVERVSGQSLADFARANVFAPLGIERTTTFCPPAELQPIAPTVWRGGVMLRGKVHGAQAERLGGVAGNGGLFSRADDLSRYCQMILDGGRWRGRTVLQPATVARMTAPIVVSRRAATRGLGWDVDSALATARGDFFPRGSFGHTGYAGVSLWVDPGSQTYAIFMSNMVHPRGQGDVRGLRARLFSIVASSLEDVDVSAWRNAESRYSTAVSTGLAALPEASPTPLPSPLEGRVLNGVDVWQADHFAALKGLRVGLVTDPTAVARDGTSTLDLLRKAAGIAGLREISLPGSLEGIDLLVYDRPEGDASLRLCLEAAAAARRKLVVLDRPNPLGGELCDGPLSDLDGSGLPRLHGLTPGEMARMWNAEDRLKADLQVVALEGWRRSMTLEYTGLPCPDPDTLLFRPGLSMLESTNLQLAQDYQWFGAPWLDGGLVADYLNGQEVEGVRFVPGRRVIGGQTCDGCYLVVLERARIRGLRVGLEIGCALARVYRREWLWQGGGRPDALFQRMHGARITPARIQDSWRAALERYRQRRRPYLIYP